jgi:hypothetical protein
VIIARTRRRRRWRSSAQPSVVNAITRPDRSCWIIGDRLLHAVAVAIRTELLDEMLSAFERYRAIDSGISRWAASRGHRVGYTWPSLVDHLDIEPGITRRRPREHSRRAGRVGRRLHWDDSSAAL